MAHQWQKGLQRTSTPPCYKRGNRNPGGTSGKEPTCQCRRHRRHRLDPRVRKIPWRRKWQPTTLFLPGEFPWTEEPGGLQSIALQRVGHDWGNLSHMHERNPKERWFSSGGPSWWVDRMLIPKVGWAFPEHWGRLSSGTALLCPGASGCLCRDNRLPAHMWTLDVLSWLYLLVIFLYFYI